MSQNSPRGQALAQAASSLIGTRFRLHGRDPRHGLDCVGLVYAALCAAGENPCAPEGYRLRNSGHSNWHSFAERSGFVGACGDVWAGDVLLISPGSGQQHLIISETPRLFIHAHAGLRRVVRQPLDVPINLLAHWRLP